MTARNYSNTSPPRALGAAASAGTPGVSGTITLSSVANLPSTPFTASIERTTANEELVLVTAIAGNVATCIRGYDGTAAPAHAISSLFEHVVAAIDYAEANAHIQASTGVHGVSGSVVGTTGAQTLDSKTLTKAVGLTGAADPGLILRAKTANPGTPPLRVTNEAGSTTLATVDSTGAYVGSAADLVSTDTGKTTFRIKKKAAQTAKALLVASDTDQEMATLDQHGRLKIETFSSGLTDPLLDLRFPSGTFDVFRIRETTGSTDVFAVDGTGAVDAATLIARGFFTADKIKTSDDGFKVDSSNNVVGTGYGSFANGVRGGSNAHSPATSAQNHLRGTDSLVPVQVIATSAATGNILECYAGTTLVAAVGADGKLRAKNATTFVLAVDDPAVSLAGVVGESFYSPFHVTLTAAMVPSQRRFKVTFVMRIDATAAATWDVRVRQSASTGANATTSDPIVMLWEGSTDTAGGAGQQTVTFVGTFLTSTPSRIGVSIRRTTGSGTITFQPPQASGVGQRGMLLVEDLGDS